VTEYETTGPDGEPTLALHPLCALFPRMKGAELEELAEDIRRNGQREPGTLYQSKIIDGGNRFEGCRIAGRKFRAREYKGDDPLGFVLATNYRRRHLTLEQRRQFRQGVIKLYPDKSDRALGELLGVDHKTIAADRAALEQTGEISPVERRTGLDGKARQQPAPKPPRPIGVKIDKVTVDPAITAAGIDRVNAMLKRPPIAHDYVPPPEPTAPIPNQQEISARVDLARSISAERLAQIPEQPDDDYGSLSFRVPADPKRMAKCILDKVGHQRASEVLDALAALLAPPQTKTPQ
jgi:hypothetical protein